MSYRLGQRKRKHYRVLNHLSDKLKRKGSELLRNHGSQPKRTLYFNVKVRLIFSFPKAETLILDVANDPNPDTFTCDAVGHEYS